MFLKFLNSYQIFKTALGRKADLERFGGLMTELENDFYVTYKYETESYEFSSKILRDWWLRNYGMTV